MSEVRRCSRCNKLVGRFEIYPNNLCFACDEEIFWSIRKPIKIPVEDKDKKMKSRCWKCNNRILTNNDRGAIGLCSDCWESALKGAAWIVGFIVYTLVYKFAPLPSVEGTVGVERLVLGLLGAFVATILLLVALVIAAVVLFLLWQGLLWLVSWPAALFRLGVASYKELQEKEIEDAKQRAQLAEPKILSGMELDALLTEEYKQKNGWN